MKELILATGNAHKVEEFAGLLAGLPYKVQSAAVCGGMPEVEETGSTFAENARLKAAALRFAAPSGADVLADDSGLEVDALEGAPGIYSARYAGVQAPDEANVEKLLQALEGMPPAARGARFRCVLCLIGPEHQVEFFEGRCEGRIAMAPKGGKGFGYDPVFVPEGYEMTFAELGESVKQQLSHRAMAVRAMRASIRDLG
ncbi:MAG: RdgB/HAM1 family non-canonical purine NTP pyrophosphatase [Opitutales bacterium]